MIITCARFLSRNRYVGSKSIAVFSLFSFVDDLGEIIYKKQAWSNAKAFRVIDRADVLQIDQVSAILGIRVSLAANTLSVFGQNQQRPCVQTEGILPCSINVVKFDILIIDNSERIKWYTC